MSDEEFIPGSAEPTEAQKSAGNYRKGHRLINGMRISIENAAGTTRRGVGKDGKPWESTLNHDYGYVRGSKGHDKDAIDVFLGPHNDKPDAKVFVIDQNDPETGKLDEHKVMLGFDNEHAAYKSYHSEYPLGWRGYGDMVEMSVPEFKKWAYKGKTRGKRKAAAEYVAHADKRPFAAGGSVDVPEAVTPRVTHDYAAGGAVLKGVERVIQKAKDLKLFHGGADTPTGALRGNDAGVLYGARQRSVADDYRDFREEGGKTHALRVDDANFADELTLRAAAKRLSGPYWEGNLEFMTPASALDSNLNPNARAIVDALMGEGFNGAVGKDVNPFGSRSKVSDFNAYAIFPNARTRPITKAAGGLIQSEEDLSKPAFRTPMIAKRREDRQDRAGATEMPAQLLRGLLTGTLGFGGDMEGAGRALANALGAEVDATPALPTGDFYSDVLPGKPSSAAGRAASGLGALGAVPASVAATGALRGVVGGAKAAAPVLRGAFERLAENAAKTETIGGRRMGSPQQRQTGAIKNPGGNWTDLAERVAKDARGWETEPMEGIDASSPVADWMEKRSLDYIRNKMGTAGDPLLKLEKEGRLHLTPDQTMDLAAQQRKYDINRSRDWQAGDPLTFEGDPLHKELTGRDIRTPWEAISDASIDPMGVSRALREGMGRGWQPEWLLKANRTGQGGDVYGLNMQRVPDLGLDHIRDYLDQATAAGMFDRQWLADKIAEGARNDNLIEAQRFKDAGLDIHPDKLAKMSFADVAGKTGDWNKAMKKWQEEANAALDMNKGIKSVMKTYPDTGYQWAELGPEALANEGTAMGHCVGGYCSGVESGRQRILSLRDDKGRPHVTVELEQPDYYKPYLAKMKELFETAEGRVPEDEFNAFQQANKEKYQGVEDGKHAHTVLNDWLKSKGQEGLAEPPWSIRQIKGKGNAAPVAEYLPAVQDLVKNMGPWGDDIGDLKNTGLMSRDQFARGSWNPSAEGMKKRGIDYNDYLNKRSALTAEELAEKLPPYFDEGDVFGALGYASGGSVGACSCHDKPAYAMGGSIGAGNTVGLGSFNASENNRPIGAAARNAGGVHTGAPQSGYGGSGVGTLDPAQYAQQIIGSGNRDLLGKVPTWNVNDPGSAEAIKQYTSGANAGIDMSGISAFMRAWSPTQFEGQGGDVDTRREVVNPDAQQTLYNMSRIAGVDPSTMMGTNFQDAQQVNALYKDLDSRLQDYRFIAGLQPGQSGLKTYETIYKKGGDGNLNPVWAREWARPEDKGWARSESGGSFLQAMSMMLPAVGGWAGLAGQTAGTTGATVANIAGNAGMGYLQGGVKGALSSLAGQAGGAAGGAGASYLNLDPSIGSYFGSRIAQEAVK